MVYIECYFIQKLPIIFKYSSLLKIAESHALHSSHTNYFNDIFITHEKLQSQMHYIGESRHMYYFYDL